MTQQPRRTGTPTTQLSAKYEAWFAGRNPELTIASYQSTIMARLERLARRETKRRKLLVAMPPGDGKSTIGTIEFAPWYMRLYADHSVMVVGYNDRLTRKFGRKIRNLCTHLAGLGTAFEGLKPAIDSHAAGDFRTLQGNEFHAAGFDGPLAGNRVDCLIIDDPVKNSVEARRESVMQERFEIYTSVLRPRLKPNGIIIMNLTRYGLHDFAGRVLDAEPDEWEQLVLPAENPDGTFLWEEYHGRKHYLDARKDTESWWSVWMQQPRAYIGSMFDRSWLNFWDLPGVDVA